jgi:hypothetical protein
MIAETGGNGQASGGGEGAEKRGLGFSHNDNKKEIL